MRVIPPLTITDAILISSSLSEPDAGSPNTEFVYDPAKTDYALGAQVISTTTHRKYESLVLQVAAHPLPVLPETATSYWLDVGPTNKWSMFDLFRNTQSSGPSPMTITLATGVRTNSIALMGLDATSVTVVVQSAVGSPSEEYYRHEENLVTREVMDWYDYFFEPFTTRPSLVLFDLPPYTSALIVTTITNTAGTAKCGALVVGSYQYIGETQHAAESDALNFSTVDRDAFGNVTLVPRRAIPSTNQRIICDKGIVNAVRNLRTALNAVPAVWSGLDDSTDEYFDAFLILGIYRGFRINASEPTEAEISLELEEI